MNERYNVPETSVSLRHITKDGEEGIWQDVVAGIEITEDGTLTIDLRNLRPVRVLDRDNLCVDVYLADVLRAIAVGVEAKLTS